jgi:hypothetical protein
MPKARNTAALTHGHEMQSDLELFGLEDHRLGHVLTHLNHLKCSVVT